MNVSYFRPSKSASVKFWHLVVLWNYSILLQVSPAVAPEELEIDIVFEWIELDSRTADSLERHLIAGGAAAVDAHSKLPDLSEKGLVKIADKVTFKVKNGDRGRCGYTGDPVKIPFWNSLTTGLNIEVGPWIESDSISLNLSSIYVASDGRVTNVKRVSISSILTPGIPTQITRFDGSTGKSSVLLATAVLAENHTKPDAVNLSCQTFVEAELYRFSTEEKRNLFLKEAARMDPDGAYQLLIRSAEVVLSVSGNGKNGQRWQIRDQMATSSSRVPKGLLFEADCFSGALGHRVDTIAVLSLETSRLAGGDKANDPSDDWIEIKGFVQREIDSGQFTFSPCVSDVKVEGGRDPNLLHLVAIRSTAIGKYLSAQEVEEKTAIEATPVDPEELYIRVFMIPPGFARRLHLQLDSGPKLGAKAIEAMKSHGVSFSKRGTSAYLSGEGLLIVRQDAPNMDKIAALVRINGGR